MTKLVVTALFLCLALNTSQARTIGVTLDPDSRKRLVFLNQTPMKSVVVRVVPRAQRRLLVTNDLEDNELPGPNELDLQSPYARKRVQKTPEILNDELSDYIMVRLAVARAKAMQSYREKWQENARFS